MICCCGRSFSTPAAFKNHSKGCNAHKRRLSSVLTKAQELYETKRWRLSSTQSTSQDEASLRDPGSRVIDDVDPQLASASTGENFVSGVRLKCSGMHSHVIGHLCRRSWTDLEILHQVHFRAKITTPYRCHFGGHEGPIGSCLNGLGTCSLNLRSRYLLLT